MFDISCDSRAILMKYQFIYLLRNDNKNKDILVILSGAVFNALRKHNTRPFNIMALFMVAKTKRFR